MIITKLQGGLGNQLFQWAVTKSLSIKYNTEYYFDNYYFSLKKNDDVSKFTLDIENIVNININNYVGKLPIIYDDFIHKDISDNSILDGYWQSEKYFIEIEDIIRNELEINLDTYNYILNKYPIINENTLSIHIRRGDYTKLQHIHPLQNLDYYKKAYDIINDNSINVLVFSDDIEWCKNNIKFDNITYIEGETNIVDMYIMSLCKHNIIANSSFSWWGAWLNKNKNKKVIAPINWFGSSSNFYTGDIIPEKWIRI
jgi:hypothetical protein